MWEQRGLSGGCLKPRGQPQQAAFLLDHRSAIRTTNFESAHVNTWESPVFLSAFFPLPIFLLLTGARMWDYSPLEAVWSNPSAFFFHHLSVFHLNHQSQLSALCHLTAFSPSEAKKGTLNASPDKKLTPLYLILHCWKAVPDHYILITGLTEQCQGCSSIIYD